MTTKKLNNLLKKHPKISRQNKMDKDKAEMFSKSTEKPVIEMDEKKIMPLYITGANLKVETPFNKQNVHFMATILHHKKTNKLEIRSRMRIDDTGDKQELPAIKDKFTIKEIDKAKQEIQKKYKQLLEEQPPFIMIKELKKPFELSFKINETADNVIQQMNDSNQFDIGIVKK